MPVADIIKQLFLSFHEQDEETFFKAALEYIELEKRKNHNIVVKELEKILYDRNPNSVKNKERRFKTALPIPRDSEKGFPLLEIKNYDYLWDELFLKNEIKKQIEQIMKEFRDKDILATYNLKYKQKILLCGKPGTGKTFTAQIVSSVLNIPMVYIRFDSIISSYLGETAANLRKVFDFIENDIWIVLFDEFDVIGKNRNDNYEHGEIKRVVNNFLQMLDNFKGDSIIFAATNHQHILDSAIWRRFDDVIYYELPDAATRSSVLDLYSRAIRKEKEINWNDLAMQTDGLSHSDLKMIACEAMKIAIIDSRNIVSKQDLTMAIEKFIKREKIKQGVDKNE